MLEKFKNSLLPRLILFFLFSLLSFFALRIHVNAATPDSCFNFDSNTGTIVDYYDNQGNDDQNPACTRDVDIPSTIDGVPVTNIGNNSFRENNITSVTIPSSVNTIGNLAFYYNSLTSLTIPDSVTSLGNEAFGTNNLVSVSISNSMTTIGMFTFASNNLTSVTIPNSVTEIHPIAFIGNSSYGKNATVIFESGDPQQMQSLYDVTRLVKLYTVDSTNPNSLQDSIITEMALGGDFNQNGNQDDIIGGHLINPQVDNSDTTAFTYPDPITSSTVTLELPSDVTNGTVSAISPTTIPKDTFFSYPLGLTSFQFDTTIGATKTITLYYDLPGDPSSYTPRKYNTNTKTFSTINNATITRVTYNNKSMIKLTYDITDGGTLDQDNTANGTVIDPVGLAQASVGVPNTGLGENR